MTPQDQTQADELKAVAHKVYLCAISKYSGDPHENIQAELDHYANQRALEAIGEDDEPRNTLEHSSRNFLRAEQRERLNLTKKGE